MEDFRHFNFVFYDLETTSLDTYQARILEIAACHADGQQFFHSYVQYPHEIPNSEIHGITQEVLQKNGARILSQVIVDLETWIAQRYQNRPVYLVAYNNLGYDKLVLECNYKKLDRPMPKNWYFMDPYPQFKELISLSSYRLTNVYQHYFKRELVGAHGAIADTRALYQVYLQLVNDVFFSAESKAKIDSVLSLENMTWHEVAISVYTSYLINNVAALQPSTFQSEFIYQPIETLGVTGFPLSKLKDIGCLEVKDLLIFYLISYPNFKEVFKKHTRLYSNFIIQKLEEKMRHCAYILYGLTPYASSKEVISIKKRIKII